MLKQLKQFWNEWGLDILVILSVCVILVLYLNNPRRRGTYSRSYFYTPPNNSKPAPAPVAARSGGDSKQEREVRALLVSLFGTPFDKARPAFLNNDVTGQNLELDCFSEKLGLAVEVNGIQHYKYTPWFHRNYDQFRTQQYRDDMKRRKCREHGITLVEIPYTAGSGDNLKKFLIDKLKGVSA